MIMVFLAGLVASSFYRLKLAMGHRRVPAIRENFTLRGIVLYVLVSFATLAVDQYGPVHENNFP